jgi:hypothetical protein
MRTSRIRDRHAHDVNVANDLAEMVTDPAQLSALRKRFESYIGEVKNKGGIR